MIRCEALRIVLLELRAHVRFAEKKGVTPLE